MPLMVLTHPFWLLGLLVVAAVALRMLIKPNRQNVVTPAISLWRQAADRAGLAANQAARRASAAWWFLLAGAVLGVFALSSPEVTLSASSRTVAIGVVPSAEFSGCRGELQDAAQVLLRRLDENDRVEWLLPVELGGSQGLMSTSRAAGRLADVTTLAPVAGRMLTPPPTSPEAQVTIWLAPPGFPVPPEAAGAVMPPSKHVYISAFRAEPISDTQVEIFARVMNPSVEFVRRPLTLRVFPVGGATPTAETFKCSIPAGGHARFRRVVPMARAFTLRIDEGRLAGQRQVQVRRLQKIVRVALVGEDNPTLRRYIQADPMLRSAASVEEADVIAACGTDKTFEKPTLYINPASPPTSEWRKGEALEHLALSRAAYAEDPILEHIDAAGMAIRHLQTWRPMAMASGKIILGIDGDGVVIRSDAAVGDESPPWVWLTFDLTPENTNLALAEPMVLMLANIFRELSPEKDIIPGYGAEGALAADVPADWTCLAGDAAQPARPYGLTPPGLYASPTGGQLAGVSLLDLTDGPSNAAWKTMLEDWPLPEPKPDREPWRLWKMLALLAAACWIIGWRLQLKD